MFAYANRVHTDAGKVAKINRLKQEGEQERAQLMVDSANQAARAERELNDYVAHEVRNPLSAAISAHAFVQTELNAQKPLATEDSRATVNEDMVIIGNSLHFINDLLRSMLDTSRASTNCMVIESKPIDIMSDVLEPIRSMLYLRDCTVDVIVECVPQDIVIRSDCLRLKQVVLNLARNSSKFVQNGFIRLRAQVRSDNHTVQLSIEDSGPGVPPEKRGQLFSKFQSSLDSLNQGTGIGLSLSKKLVELMGMNLWLDEDFDSGLEGRPGARFVIDTNIKLDDEPSHAFGVVDKDENGPQVHSDGGNDGSVVNAGTVVGSSVVMSSTVPTQTSSLESTGTQEMVTKKPQPSTLTGETVSVQDEVSLPKRLSVLFVDDDMILRKLFARTIRKVAPDWKIREASNGETSLKLVETESFDLIFMDQYMASVEQQLLGTETIRALRSRGVISAICGLSANDVRTGFLEAGADSFLFKPFPTEANALRRELRNILEAAEHRVHLLENDEQGADEKHLPCPPTTNQPDVIVPSKPNPDSAHQLEETSNASAPINALSGSKSQCAPLFASLVTSEASETSDLKLEQPVPTI